MKLPQLMSLYSKEIEVTPPLAPDAGGAYHIPLDTHTLIKLSESPLGLEYSATVCACPTNELEQFYGHMLNGNLFYQATGGAALGLSDDGKSLTLSRVLEYTADYESFRSALEDFINALDFWQEEAATHRGQ